MAELIYKDEVFAIVGAAIEIHRVLGSGFLEAVYQEAMEIETAAKEIPFVSQQVLQIQYKQHILKKEYIADMVCFEKITVEFKALDKLTGREESQVINYLKAAGYKVGVLINFGSHPKLEWKRFVY
jgi:GxxExxY protein